MVLYKWVMYKTKPFLQWLSTSSKLTTAPPIHWCLHPSRQPHISTNPSIHSIHCNCKFTFITRNQWGMNVAVEPVSRWRPGAVCRIRRGVTCVHRATWGSPHAERGRPSPPSSAHHSHQRHENRADSSLQQPQRHHYLRPHPLLAPCSRACQMESVVYSNRNNDSLSQPSCLLTQQLSKSQNHCSHRLHQCTKRVSSTLNMCHHFK